MQNNMPFTNGSAKSMPSNSGCKPKMQTLKRLCFRKSTQYSVGSVSLDNVSYSHCLSKFQKYALESFSKIEWIPRFLRKFWI